MEKQASSELYGLLKRPDEKFVTERAYDNPKFVEDMVRDVAAVLNLDERIDAVRGRVGELRVDPQPLRLRADREGQVPRVGTAQQAHACVFFFWLHLSFSNRFGLSMVNKLGRYEILRELARGATGSFMRRAIRSGGKSSR